MKTYLVGGAVRDGLLGVPSAERDWVVVGATPEAMAGKGFRPVGRDFPVFLHPETKEEYALARTERKSGRGYHGFTFHTGPDVTLEDDLVRRDLTVNAMARAEGGELIDPCGGKRDLEARVLRHVSPAFVEDPVRILRVARFHSRFASLGFRVADETLGLMKEMVANGEVDHLVAERVWQEMARALMQDQPSVFFHTLRECGALARILPEVDALFGVPQRADYHPEVDSGIHTLMCVDAGARMGAPLPVRAAALLHDLGKAKTPKDQWPGHKMHDARGVPLVEAVCERLRLPAECRDLAVMHTREHLRVHVVRDMRPETLLDLIEKIHGLKAGPRFEQVLQACVCDARGRTGYEECDYGQADFLREARGVAMGVQAADVMREGLSGPAVGDALKRKRTEALADWKSSRAGE